MRGYSGNTIPKRWEEGIICGNGTIGTIAMCEPNSERVIFCHEKLFFPLHAPLTPVDTGAHLDEIRAMMLSGDYQKAADFVVELARQEGYGEKLWTDPFYPAFEAAIDLNECGEVVDYKRSLNFSTGLGSVSWRDDRGEVYRQCFVSRADDVAIIMVSAKEKGKLTGAIALKRLLPEVENKLIGEIIISAQENYIFYREKFSRADGGFEAVARVVNIGGSIVCNKDSIAFENVDELMLFVDILPIDDFSNSKLEQIKRKLEAISLDFDGLLLEHIKLHNGIYGRTTLQIGEELENEQKAEMLHQNAREFEPSDTYYNKIFDAGRYTILSSTGELPPHLQGLWAGNYKSPWSSDYTQNGNLQTAIANTLNGNMFECMDVYLKYNESMLPAFRVNAERLFRCRGIHLPSRTSTHGYNNHFDGTWPMTFWTAGAGWASRFFYDYWLFTQDVEFFFKRALPFMKESALFYEDFLIEDETGNYCFNPSYSPENAPKNSDSQATMNATMDIAVCRELLNNLITACKTFQIEAENILKWKKILEKLPPYQINEDGALKEWCYKDHQDNYDHRHASHLYPLYYGVAKEFNENKELFDACVAAYNIKCKNKTKQAGVMAFGAIQIGMAAAHIGDKEMVEYIIKDLSKNYYYKNFSSSHNAGPSIFNADISGGLPALMIEALVQGEPILDDEGKISGYSIHLLPALLPSWKKGKLQGARTCGGFEVSIEWENGELKNCVVKNHCNKNFRIKYNDKVSELQNQAEMVFTKENFK